MYRTAFLLCACLLACFTLIANAGAAAADGQEMLTNEAVVAMVKAGLGAGTVVTKIKSSDTQFDVSTTGLIDLKSKGVPDDIIQAMVEASVKGPGRSGADASLDGLRLFLLRTGADGSMTRQPVEMSVARQRFAVGVFSFGTQIVLAGKTAVVQTHDPRPIFIFNLSGDRESLSGYVLTRFDESDEGGGRKLDLDGAVTFDSQKTGPREFRVKPNKDLKRGEYCFYLAEQVKEGWPGQQTSMTVYDFGVSEMKRK